MSREERCWWAVPKVEDELGYREQERMGETHGHFINHRSRRKATTRSGSGS